MIAVAIAAAYCAFLIRLPPGARLGVGVFGLLLAWELLSWTLPDEPSGFYALKWRRRGKKKGEEGPEKLEGPTEKGK